LHKVGRKKEKTAQIAHLKKGEVGTSWNIKKESFNRL
jgi:hypothetical protein